MSTSIPAEMVCYRFGPSFTSPREERVAVPEPKESEVLLKVLAAGVCHSDLGIFEINSHYHRAVERFGVFTCGHEGAGVIVSLGKNVANTHPSLKAGTYVAIFGPNSCWEPSCLPCSSGNENICPKHGAYGLAIDGAWAEYVAVRADNVVPVPGTPEQISPSVVAIATDAILTPYHALKGRCDIQPGQTVLCYGAGGLGLHAVAIAKHVLGANVIACDLRESSLQQALSMGADHAAKPDDLHAYLVEHNLIVDVAVDFVGGQKTFDACVAVVRVGGTVHILGLMTPTLTITPLAMMVKNLTVRTSYWGRKEELAEILQAIVDGKLTTSVEELPMSDCANVLHELHEGKIKGRIAIIPDSLISTTASSV